MSINKHDNIDDQIIESAQAHPSNGGTYKLEDFLAQRKASGVNDMDSIERQNLRNFRANLEKQWKHNRPYRWHEWLYLWVLRNTVGRAVDFMAALFKLLLWLRCEEIKDGQIVKRGEGE